MKTKLFACVILFTIMCCCACSNISTSTEETSSESETAIPQDLLDDSEMRADISNILNDNITEARILSWGLTYWTSDANIIEEIKNKISQMNLTETESKYINDENPPAGGQILTLYLLQGDKILYQIHTDNRFDIFTVCGKPYSIEKNGFDNVLSYCRKTFFDGQ